MPKRKRIPDYSTVKRGNITYYRTRLLDTDGKRVSLYARTREELYEKELAAQRYIDNIISRGGNPTVEEYSEKWLYMQSARIRATTLIDYTSKVRRHIIEPLGDLYMYEVTTDDIRMALVPLSKKSAAVYRSVIMLLKCIFKSALDNHLIDDDPTIRISSRGGVPEKGKEALTNEQVSQLLAAIEGLPPYVFVMLGLYAGLRREEILGLKWDCVFIDEEPYYIAVRRAWHSEHNRPIILDELKTSTSYRDVPIPPRLVECLREAKKNSKSDFVVANSDGNPLSYTQFQRLWQYIVTRSTKERTYVRYVDGERIKKTVKPVLGQPASHNTSVVYSLDFQVTPHQLRHTYITNLIYASVDPKTVQYLAGHKNSKITMDIYAKVKYNRPAQLSSVVNNAFAQLENMN